MYKYTISTQVARSFPVAFIAVIRILFPFAGLGITSVAHLLGDHIVAALAAQPRTARRGRGARRGRCLLRGQCLSARGKLDGRVRVSDVCFSWRSNVVCRRVGALILVTLPVDVFLALRSAY